MKRFLKIELYFARAFNTIEKSCSCLDLFSYGDNSISMIQLLHKNSHSVVENNGRLSKNILLSRGCQQRHPIYPLLQTEILPHSIRECRDIRGIEVHSTEIAIFGGGYYIVS